MGIARRVRPIEAGSPFRRSVYRTGRACIIIVGTSGSAEITPLPRAEPRLYPAHNPNWALHFRTIGGVLKAKVLKMLLRCPLLRA